MAKKEEWGLTDAGFRRPTYADLLEALELKARELFGPSANLTVRSPLGIFLRIYAWVLDSVYSTIEDVYNSRFVDTAVGNSLYNLGRAIGLRVLGAQKAVGYLTFNGVDNTHVPKGYLAETANGIQFVTQEGGPIKDGSITLPAISVATGVEGNVEARTITVITNPKLGINSVSNAQKFEGGRLKETDAEFRKRYYLSVDFAGGVNLDAIIAEIYKSVEGVISVKGLENDTDETDNNGLPPHSIELIVHGGLDSDIAKAIYRRKAAGIQTHGTISISVNTLSSKQYFIKFSRPLSMNVWVKVYNLKTNKNFPVNGRDLIKSRIIEYIGADTQKGLAIGENVVCIKIPTEVLKVPGVVDFDLQISKNNGNYSWENITINQREKAITNESMVIIE